MKLASSLKVGLLLAILSLIIPLLAFSKTEKKNKYIPVADAFKKGLVDVELISKGGHEGDCMSMKVTNRINDSLFLAIEPGRILNAFDSAMQDILIIHDENFLLASGEKADLSIYGFCCESNNGSPRDSANFSLGAMGDSNLVAIAKFLNENDYPPDIAQEAVWAISDDHSIASVYAEDVANIDKLKEFLSDLKGVEIPWYSAEYEESGENDLRVFTERVESIAGEVEIWIPHHCIVDIRVEDQMGKIMEVFEEMVAYGPGRYFYEFKFPVFDWPKGKYYLTIRTDGNALYRKEFEL